LGNLMGFKKILASITLGGGCWPGPLGKNGLGGFFFFQKGTLCKKKKKKKTPGFGIREKKKRSGPRLNCRFETPDPHRWGGLGPGKKKKKQHWENLPKKTKKKPKRGFLTIFHGQTKNKTKEHHFGGTGKGGLGLAPKKITPKTENLSQKKGKKNLGISELWGGNKNKKNQKQNKKKKTFGDKYIFRGK